MTEQEADWEPDWTTCVRLDCVGFPMKGQRACLAHVDSDVRQAFLATLVAGSELDLRGVPIDSELLGQLLSAVRPPQGLPTLGLVMFDRAQFGERTVFDGVRFSADVSFDGAQFRASAQFKETQFSGDVLFTGVQFSVVALFDGAQFGREAMFQRAQFHGITSFDKARFAREAAFSEAKFSEMAQFQGTRFAKAAEFGGAEFSKDAVFVGAAFSGSAEFRDVRFSGATQFGGVRFGESALFNGAQFGDVARFERAQFGGDATFVTAQFSGDARFEMAQFSERAAFGEAQFSKAAVFNNAQFGRDAWFGEAVFTGEAWFVGAQFNEGAGFTDARFSERAAFAAAQFTGDAGFGRARFGEIAGFQEAQFTGEAWFAAAQFSERAEFDRAQFDGSAGFVGAHFDGEARFTGAEFNQARSVGPLFAAALVLDRATFEQPVTIEAASAILACVDARFNDTATLRLRYAETVVDRSVFTRPSTITFAEDTFKPRDGVDEDAFDESPLAQVAGGRAPWPRLLSLRGVDVAMLTLSELDLAACLFQGAHHLDQLRIEGARPFADAPAAWRLHLGRWWVPVWRRWSRRQTVAEEHHWRSEHPSPAAPGRWSWLTRPAWHGPACQTPAWVEEQTGQRLRSARLAVLYRALRKAQEDSKNEPGAADFYYGEMEMRRLNRQTPWAERMILRLYWLVSGYGLRGLRALAWLMAVVVGLAGLLQAIGFNGGDPGFRDALIYAAQSTISIASGNKALTEHVSWAGEVLRIALRLVGPILLGLMLLSIRNRVKR